MKNFPASKIFVIVNFYANMRYAVTYAMGSAHTYTRHPSHTAHLAPHPSLHNSILCLWLFFLPCLQSLSFIVLSSPSSSSSCSRLAHPNIRCKPKVHSKQDYPLSFSIDLFYKCVAFVRIYCIVHFPCLNWVQSRTTVRVAIRLNLVRRQLSSSAHLIITFRVCPSPMVGMVCEEHRNVASVQNGSTEQIRASRAAWIYCVFVLDKLSLFYSCSALPPFPITSVGPFVRVWVHDV